MRHAVEILRHLVPGVNPSIPIEEEQQVLALLKGWEARMEQREGTGEASEDEG